MRLPRPSSNNWAIPDRQTEATMAQPNSCQGHEHGEKTDVADQKDRPHFFPSSPINPSSVISARASLRKARLTQ